MRSNRPRVIKIAAVFLTVILACACIEIFFFNYHALRYSNNNVLEISGQELLAGSTGFRLDGTELTDTADNASIQYQFDAGYYSKLFINYKSSTDSDISIILGSQDTMGNPTSITLSDHYDHRLTQSVTNINEHVNSISIVFPTQGITIQNISLTNEMNFNVLRFVFMIITGLVLAFIIFSKKIIAERVELAFLIIAIGIGALLIILVPLKNPIVWDDDTHFHKIYQQAAYGQDVTWTQAAYDYDKRLVPPANTIEEKTEVIQLLNNEDDASNPVLKEKTSTFIPYNLRAYIPQSAMIFAARGLGLNFTTQQAAGRIGGYLFYILIVCAAIGMAKFGKRIIAVIALMPTPLFMAANYSYDPFVISLSILAFVAFANEYFDPLHRINWKNMAVFLAATILVCSTKALYIPLILVFLLVPKEKFQSRRERLLFTIGILAICLAVLLTFVLPTVINPSTQGDIRGGDTSISGQITFILGNPLYYARVLLKSIWDYLGSFLLGNGTFLNFAYLGISSNNSAYLSVIVIFFAVLTDCRKDDPYTFKKSSKIFIAVLIFSVICLIWTSMYLAFTPVGMDSINGVQSRYYLPFIVPLLFLFRNHKIETSIRPVTLNRIVLFTCAFISFSSIYDLILKPFCF